VGALQGPFLSADDGGSHFVDDQQFRSSSMAAASLCPHHQEASFLMVRFLLKAPQDFP